MKKHTLARRWILLLRVLACYWVALGIWGISKAVSAGLDTHDFLPWAAVTILLLLSFVGLFTMAGKRWAQAVLWVPVSFVSMYTADVCYAHIWHHRFHAEFWLMMVPTLLGGLTVVCTLICFIIREKNKLPPVIRRLENTQPPPSQRVL
jgi:hypothetical protein